jgi:hypothetical protein
MPARSTRHTRIIQADGHEAVPCVDWRQEPTGGSSAAMAQEDARTHGRSGYEPSRSTRRRQPPAEVGGGLAQESGGDQGDQIGFVGVLVIDREWDDADLWR